MPIAEFDDPRLAAIYDTVNTHEPDEQPRFVHRLLSGLGPGLHSVVDVGCGTGLIARELAGLGHRVVGLDPSAEMVAVGRTRPFGDRVRWIVGEVDALDEVGADLAIMTSHVAQFFVDDDHWARALEAIHRALRPGGVLGFESRNPDACGWASWTPDEVLAVVDPVAGPIETWTEVHDVRDGVVRFTNRYRFLATGEVLASTASLRFRTLDQLTTSLGAAGFAVERVHGDWDGGPVGPSAPEHVVVAHRR